MSFMLWFSPLRLLVEYVLLAVRETLLFSSRRKIRAQNFFSRFFFFSFRITGSLSRQLQTSQSALTPLIKTYLLRVINHLIYLLCTFFFVSSWSRRTSAFFCRCGVVLVFLACHFTVAYSDESRSNLKTSDERQLDNEKVFCNYSN